MRWVKYSAELHHKPPEDTQCTIWEQLICTIQLYNCREFYVHAKQEMQTNILPWRHHHHLINSFTASEHLHQNEFPQRSISEVRKLAVYDSSEDFIGRRLSSEEKKLNACLTAPKTDL